MMQACSIARIRPCRRFWQTASCRSVLLSSLGTARCFSEKEPSIVGDTTTKWNEIAPDWTGIDPAVRPFLRRCDSLPEDERERKTLLDTGFHLYFLGSGSGTGELRAPSCTVVRFGSEAFLFDAGEGSQYRIKQSSAKLNRITRIFITHLHGDHVLGLPGILLSSNVANLGDDKATLQVYGPPGIYNFITTNLVLTHAKLRSRIEVLELVGGQVRLHWKRRGMTTSYPHFQHENVVRKTINCGEDGVWKIKEFEPISRDLNPRKLVDLKISAAEVHHVPNVQTFGYVLEEKKPTPKIDPMRAIKLGLKPGRKYNELKLGYPVMNDDGTREVKPEEVLYDNSFRARKIALLGDSCGVPTPMARLCRDADVLVHEATLAEKDRSLSVNRGHSTASMAGQFADAANIGVLVLNHHSNTRTIPETQQTARDAENAIRGGTRVVGAYDFMEVAVPREGFQANRNYEFAPEDLAEKDMLSEPPMGLLPKEDLSPKDDNQMKKLI